MRMEKMDLKIQGSMNFRFYGRKPQESYSKIILKRLLSYYEFRNSCIGLQCMHC